MTTEAARDSQRHPAFIRDLFINVFANLVAGAIIYLGAVLGGYLKANPFFVAAASALIGAVAVFLIIRGGFRYVTSAEGSGIIAQSMNPIFIALGLMLGVALLQAVLTIDWSGADPNAAAQPQVTATSPPSPQPVSSTGSTSTAAPVAEAPSVTDWMQGWGNVIGVLMSSIAVFFTGWLLRHEIRVRREEKVDSGAVQARLVLGQVIGYGGAKIDPETGDTLDEITSLNWEVRNYSQMPIYQMGIWIECWGVDENEEYHVDYEWPVVEGRISGEISLPFAIPPGEATSNFTVVCMFVDNNGLYWRRFGMAPPERTNGSRDDLAEPNQAWPKKLFPWLKKSPEPKSPRIYTGTIAPMR